MNDLERRTVVWLAAAAIAVGVVGCGGKSTQQKPGPLFVPAPKKVVPPPPPPASAPETEEMTLQGAVKLDYPAPGFRGDPARFTWYRFPEAATYQVSVMTSTETDFYDSPPATENLFDPPPGWTTNLQSGLIYFWQVTAFNDEGTPIGKSSYRDFVFEP